jgi:hypothetical protein
VEEVKAGDEFISSAEQFNCAAHIVRHKAIRRR